MYLKRITPRLPLCSGLSRRARDGMKRWSFKENERECYGTADGLTQAHSKGTKTQ